MVGGKREPGFCMILPATHRVAGHFGELIQGRLGTAGPVVLISLPCPALTVTATAIAAHDLSLYCPNGPILTTAQVQKFLGTLGLPPPGQVTLTAQMPLGGGAGSSTAALVALARLAGWTGPAIGLARACLAIEGATDPLMFDHAEQLLWASRHAEIIKTLPALPLFDALGGFYGAPQKTDATDQNFPDVADLVQDWTAAALAQDLPALANLAATSAHRSMALRGGLPDPTAQLAKDLRALGHVIAHTGSARGLIFARGTVPPDARAAMEQAGFKGIVQFTAGGRA